MTGEADRDMVIRLEQQLKDSIQNQSLIMKDLKEIFQRIEKESKATTTLAGDIKGHIENQKFRWDELNKKLDSYADRIDDCETDIKEHENFEQTIVASFKTARFFISILAGVATLISVFAAALQILSYLKG